MQYIPYVIAVLIPVVVLYVIFSLDLYQSGSFRWVVACFLWGGAAFFLARYVNRYIYFNAILTRDEIIQYSAPFAEEVLKALVLFYLVRRPKFTYFVDGAIYGFAVGIGFAVFENFEYIMATSDAGLGTAISRVISTNLMHASATALTGVSVGLSRFQRSYRKIGVALSGLIAAILLHVVFNNLVTRLSGGMVLLASTVLALAAVGLIAWLIFRGLAEQRHWIEEKLGMADRVTAGEARVVQKLEDVGELLKPLRQTFGDEKGDQIEKFLMIQARLGIKRKTLEKLPDEKLRQAVAREMDELRQEMDAVRRQLGPYVMLYVRQIFPEQTSPLFGLLERRIQERIEARQTAGSTGANLFASLGQRMAARPSGAPPTDPPMDK